MSTPEAPATVRRATAADVDSLRQLARSAYQMYVVRMDRPPAPVTADYGRHVSAGHTWVAESGDEVVGLLVIVAAEDHLLVDNVAVAPTAQGRGVGTLLLDFAEQQARASGLAQLRLYTNEAMIENIEFYARLGYRVTRHARENGYARVFFAKDLA